MKQLSQFLFLYAFLAFVSWTSDVLAGNGDGNPGTPNTAHSAVIKPECKAVTPKVPAELTRKGLYVCSQVENSMFNLSDTAMLSQLSTPKKKLAIHDLTSSDPQTERRVIQHQLQTKATEKSSSEQEVKPAPPSKNLWMEFLNKLQRVFSYSTGLVTGV